MLSLAQDGTMECPLRKPNLLLFNWIVELKNTVTPPQENEAVPECAAPTKMQQSPCTTYPIPLPSPDSYAGKTW